MSRHKKSGSAVGRIWLDAQVRSFAFESVQLRSSGYDLFSSMFSRRVLIVRATVSYAFSLPLSTAMASDIVSTSSVSRLSNSVVELLWNGESGSPHFLL